MPQVQHGGKALPRNGSGVYSLPGTYEATTGTTILAAQHNDPLEDLQTDMNTARPIVAGGTGAASAVAANDGLNTTANNIASAATVDLSTATGVVVNITGTTTITALGTVASGAERVLIFAGALTLTHNGTSLILPGAANITTAAGDVATFRSLGSGNWRCVGYHQASGFLSINANSIVLRPVTSIATINTDDDGNSLILQAGSTASQGAQILLYGDGHATKAGDITFMVDGSGVYEYDSVTAVHNFSNKTIAAGTFSLTGATAGTNIDLGLLKSSANGTGSTTHQAYYNPNGNVGGIATSGTATTFATSSDATRKTNRRDFDAIAIIDALEVWHFDWINGGSGYGVMAQDAREVFPDPIVEFPDGSLGADYSKYVPLLLRGFQQILQRNAALEARVAALEAA